MKLNHLKDKKSLGLNLYRFIGITAATLLSLFCFSLYANTDSNGASNGCSHPAPAEASIICASSEDSPDNETKEKAFDGDIRTKWRIFEDSGWIQFDFKGHKAKVIKRYRITSASDFPERDPKDWFLMGSNNGINWTTIDLRHNECFSGRHQTKTYRVDNEAHIKSTDWILLPTTTPLPQRPPRLQNSYCWKKQVEGSNREKPAVAAMKKH